MPLWTLLRRSISPGKQFHWGGFAQWMARFWHPLRQGKALPLHYLLKSKGKKATWKFQAPADSVQPSWSTSWSHSQLQAVMAPLLLMTDLFLWMLGSTLEVLVRALIFRSLLEDQENWMLTLHTVTPLLKKTINKYIGHLEGYKNGQCGTA